MNNNLIPGTAPRTVLLKYRSDIVRIVAHRASRRLPALRQSAAHLPLNSTTPTLSNFANPSPALRRHFLQMRRLRRQFTTAAARGDRSTLPIENQLFVSSGEGVFIPAFSFPGTDACKGLHSLRG
jgi:hypothetical protein